MSKLTELIEELCPEGVEYRTIEELFDTRNGYTPSRSNPDFWVEDGIPWFRMDDIRINGYVLDESLQHISPEAVKGGKLFPAGTVIVATSATIGEHALLKVPALANQRFTALIRKPEFSELLLPKFVHYYCFVLDDWCLRNTTQSSFASVDMPRFRKFRFPVPPLEVQEEIVRLLDAFTDLEQSLVSELELRNKQFTAILDDLVYGEASGIWEDDYQRLGDVAHYSTDRVDAVGVSSSDFVGVDNLLPDLSGVRISTYGPNTKRVTAFVEGDVLLGNIRPYLRKMWMADRSGGCSGDVLSIRINESVSEKLTSKYLYYALAADRFFDFNMQHSRGGKMPRGSKQMILQYTIPVPPFACQKDVVAKLDGFSNLIQSIEQEIALRRKQYEFYRDALLNFTPKEA